MKISLTRIIAYPLIILGLMLAGVLLSFRYYGLPEQIGQRIALELKTRGITIHSGRLYLDPFGGVVAQNLVISETKDEITRSLMIEKIRFRFNWISWWRKEPFLEGATLSKADLTFPLDKETAVQLSNVNAEILFAPNLLQVRSLEGDWLNLHLQFHGVVDLAGFTPRSAVNPPDFQKQAELYRTLLTIASYWSAPRPVLVDVQFKALPARPLESEIHVRVHGVHQAWKGVVVEDINLDADYEDSVARFHGEVQFLRGRMTFDGNWKEGAKSALLSFYSDADLSLLASGLPGRAGDFLADVRFFKLPVNEGRVDLNWENGFKYLLQTRSDWRDFLVQDSHVESLYLPLSFDGSRIMVSDMTVKADGGDAVFNLFYDGDQVLKAHLTSSVDPTAFKKLFGEGARPFFDSLSFSTPPEVDCVATGTGLAPELLTLAGTMRARDFSYKKVPLAEVKSSFEFKENELHLPDLYVKRTEGEGRGEVWDNLKTKQVRIKGAKGTLNLQDTAIILGNKMAEYAAPYGFLAPSTFAVDGQVDLDTQQNTDLHARIQCPQGMKYVFLKKMLTLSDLDASLVLKGSHLSLKPNKPIRLFGGQLNGTLDMQLLKRTTYNADATLTDENFGLLMKTFFGNDDVKGSVTGVIKVRGLLDDMKTMSGDGDFTVTNGVLYNIPVFGGLSQVLNSIIPDLGYSEARSAKAAFIIKDGVINVSKVDVASSGFALIGYGTYDIIEDKVDMSMRVNMRGILGVPLFFVSKLFEYEGTGTLSKTKWEPKVF